MPSPPTELDEKLTAFLKKQRGDSSFAEFSRKRGLPVSTLHRLENGEQSITLGRLHGLMKKLKVTLGEMRLGDDIALELVQQSFLEVFTLVPVHRC